MGWSYIELSQICDILDKRRKPITKKNRVPGPYPYFGASGVLDYVDDFIFDEELVLLGEDGAKWGEGENSAFSISGKTWVNNHAHVLRPDRDKILDSWLIYYLNASDLSPFISGMTVPKLNQGRLREIEIPIPPISEQKRIVAILDEAFADIDKARALTERNLENARELFESYLQSVLTDHFCDAEEVNLGDEIDLLTGFAFKSKDYSTDANAIPLVRGDNIIQGSLRWKGVKRWPMESSGEYSKYYLERNDLVLAMDRTWVKAGMKFAIINSDDLPALLVQRVARLRCLETLLPKYLYYLLGSKLFEKYVLSIQTGLGVPHISGKQIQAFRFKRPNVDQQKKVIAALTSVSENAKHLCENYSSKLETLDELKKSLLQKAFTGELTKAA
ncbi:restriction endonuclease subunit S [Idiomarina piscisalsi]|uniref:restriction endonuclease subunit S n=1 Tax=Idiomarina piscisalsi TaxID=1096243 RepID=UPI001E46FB8E|nr:restriction endonuclease subunit S [Idiomarina piscisalsi]